MKIVYIAHPISGDVIGNLTKIREIVRRVNLICERVVPFVPYYADCVSLDDNDPAQRKRGIQNDHELLPLAHELWLFGEWRSSRGCCAEKDFALSLKIPVYEILEINCLTQLPVKS